jgi:hypothetical protein
VSKFRVLFLLLVASTLVLIVLAGVVHHGSSGMAANPKGGLESPPPSATEFPRSDAPAAMDPDRGEVLAGDIVFRILCAGSQDQTLRLPDYLVQLANHSPRAVVAPFDSLLLKKGTAWFELTDDRGRTIKVDVESLNRADPGSPYASNSLVPSHRAYVQLFGSPALGERILLPEIRALQFVYAASEGSGYQELARQTPRGDLLPPVRLYSQTYHLVQLK